MGVRAWVWVWAWAWVSCAAFNVDIDNHVSHAGDQQDSLFGFAVAQHKDQGRSKLLVGAPLYNTAQWQPGVVRAGAVLQCDPDVPNSCQYVPFDRYGNYVHPLGQQLDNKSFQWFGATVRSSGPDGVVVACAPRYVWFTESLDKREPVGTCYVARRGLTDFQEYSPCRTRHWGYHRQGSCQAGFDAVITEDGNRMFIGAPGAFYWQGQCWMAPLAGQIHSQNLTLRPDYRMTWEGPAWEDDQLLGYSATVGDFSGDGQKQDVALGVPKGLNYTGKVAIFTADLVPLQNITGYQLGSYFGYCLAVVDFNNDGLDDIVVGAPLYTNYNDREMKFEVGRVHVMLQNRLHRFRQVVTLTGEVSQGRFGLSIAALGDINMDQIDDMAVGAPYGGPDGSGAVFIYHGFEIRSGELISEDLKKPSQVVLASDVGLGVPMAAFGWSLSGGMDMDNNQYPDLLVGASHANAVVLLRSRPIVHLFNHSVTFLSESKSIDIDVNSATNLELNCRTLSGRVVPCVDLEFCVSYGGVGVPKQIDVEVQYLLDGKVSDPRLFFHENDQQGLSQNVKLQYEAPSCWVHKTYVSPTLKDKLNPLGAEVKLELMEPLYRRPRSLTPILDQKQRLKLTNTINIQKNCGNDNICIPDLVLNFTAPDTFVYGKKEQLEVDVRVTNYGEDAYEARVYLTEPPGLQYNIFVAQDNTSVTCSPRYQGQITTLICDIGNPLQTLMGVHFTVLFQQQSETLEDHRLEFEVVANSTIMEEERTQSDNYAKKTVLVDVDTELVLYGSSSPESIAYNKTLYRTSNWRHEEHLGPEILHTYALSNNGRSPLQETQFVILWPTKTINDDYLLYLLEQPVVTGSASCSLVPDVNPLNLQLDRRAGTLELVKLRTGQGAAEDEVVVEGDYESSYEGTVEVEGEGEVESSEGEAAISRASEGSSGGSSRASSGGSSRGSSGGSSGRSTYYEESTTYYSSSGGGGGGRNSSHSSSSSTSHSSSSSSSRTYSSSSSSSSSFGKNYGESSTSSDENQFSRRTRRAVTTQNWDDEINNCGPTKCTRIHCVAGPMEEHDIAHIYVRSRLFLTTLAKYPKEVSITSRIVARVTSLSHGMDPDALPVKSLDVTTSVSPAKSLDEAPQIPWWVIVLATLAGILILLLIILILWKCGYFKRHRPEQKMADDAQPLNPPNNRNGHSHSPYGRPFYPGDEAL